MYANSITISNPPYSYNLHPENTKYSEFVVLATKIPLKVIYASTTNNYLRSSLKSPFDAQVSLYHEGLHLRNNIDVNNDLDLKGINKHLAIYLKEVSSIYFDKSSSQNKDLTNHNIKVLFSRIKQESPLNWITLINEWKIKFRNVGYNIWN